MISGGGKNSETELQAAIRGLREETLLISNNWLQLDSMCMLPKHYYEGHALWNNVQYFIPESSLMTLVNGRAVISNEHCERKWYSIKQANSLLKFASNKIEFWVLNQRIKNNFIL